MSGLSSGCASRFERFSNSLRHYHDKNEISWIALGDWGGQSVETIEPFHLLHEMPWQVYVTPKGRVPELFRNLDTVSER